MEYQLVVDTWESGGEINEQVYKDNDIAALIIRLNDMSGGHHADTGFAKQWAEAADMLRAPYFVYNPWVNGAQNFEVLKNLCPHDAHTVMVDVEVRPPIYVTKSTYAKQFDIFMDLVGQKFGSKNIYTGGWFASYLAYWPEDANYWWAQYPYALYPEKTTYSTWGAIRKIIEDNQFIRPFNWQDIPGTYKMWQCSGDRYVLPGNDRIIDINIFPGSKAELREFLGYPEIVDPPPPPPPAPTGQIRVNGFFEAVDNIVTTFFPDDTPTEPPPPPLAEYDPENPPEETETTEWTLYSHSVDFLVCRRTPDETDGNSFQFHPFHESTVLSAPMDEERNHGGNLVRNWNSSAEKENLKNKWTRLFIQSVWNNNYNPENPNAKMMWTHGRYPKTGKPWNLNGVYVLTADLVAMSTPPVDEPEPPDIPDEPVSYDDPADDPNWVAIRPPLSNFPTPDPNYHNPDLDPANPDYQTPDNFVRWYPEPEYIPHDGYTWVQYNRDTEIRHGEDVPQTATMMIRNAENTKWIEKEEWLQCTEEMQWHIWYNVQRDNPDRSHDYHLWAFRQFMANHKWVTDLQDYDNHTNFVLAHFVDPVKYNLAKNDPFWFKVSLSTKENLWRGEFDGSVFVAQCLDYNNYPDPSQWSALYDKRHLAQHCTQTTTRKRDDGTIVTTNFPHGRYGALQANGKREKTRTTWFNIYPGGHIGIAKVHLTVLGNGSGPHWRVNLDRPNPYI